jgi:hypothetical protein
MPITLRVLIASTAALAVATIAFFLTNIVLMGEMWHIGLDSARPLSFLMDDVNLAIVYALPPVLIVSCLVIFGQGSISIYKCTIIFFIWLIFICTWETFEVRSWYGGKFSWDSFQRSFFEFLPALLVCAFVYFGVFRKLVGTKPLTPKT